MNNVDKKATWPWHEQIVWDLDMLARDVRTVLLERRQPPPAHPRVESLRRELGLSAHPPPPPSSPPPPQPPSPGRIVGKDDDDGGETEVFSYFQKPQHPLMICKGAAQVLAEASVPAIQGGGGSGSGGSSDDRHDDHDDDPCARPPGLVVRSITPPTTTTTRPADLLSPLASEPVFYPPLTEFFCKLEDQVVQWRIEMAQVGPGEVQDEHIRQVMLVRMQFRTLLQQETKFMRALHDAQNILQDCFRQMITQQQWYTPTVLQPVDFVRRISHLNMLYDLLTAGTPVHIGDICSPWRSVLFRAYDTVANWLACCGIALLQVSHAVLGIYRHPSDRIMSVNEALETIIPLVKSRLRHCRTLLKFLRAALEPQMQPYVQVKRKPSAFVWRPDQKPSSATIPDDHRRSESVSSFSNGESTDSDDDGGHFDNNRNGHQQRRRRAQQQQQQQQQQQHRHVQAAAAVAADRQDSAFPPHYYYRVNKAAVSSYTLNVLNMIRQLISDRVREEAAPLLEQHVWYWSRSHVMFSVADDIEVCSYPPEEARIVFRNRTLAALPRVTEDLEVGYVAHLLRHDQHSLAATATAAAAALPATTL